MGPTSCIITVSSSVRLLFWLIFNIFPCCLFPALLSSRLSSCLGHQCIELSFTRPSLHLPLQSQTQLGWNQLFYGRFSNTWATAIDSINPNLAITGEVIVTTIIKHIWTYVLQLWKLRNEHLHNNAAQLDLPDYKQAAQTLYEQKHLLSPQAQETLFKQPLDHTLNQPPNRLQQWVIRGYRYFTQQIKAEKKQAAMSTPDIRTFFRPLAQHPDDLHPP